MPHSDQTRLVSIGAVAEALSVSESIIRVWERDGLIDPPARVGGDNRRCYRPDEVEALRLIAEGRRLRRRQPATEAVRT